MTSNVQAVSGTVRLRSEDHVAARRSSLRLAGALLLGVGAGFIVVTMLAASIAPGYDFNAAAISELGTLPETAAIFNGLLVVIGLMNIVGGFALYRAVGHAWLVALFGVAGLGAIGAGLVPMNVGDAHALFAFVGFLFFNLQALALVAVVRGAFRWLGVAAGALGLVYLVVMVIGDGGNPAIFGAIGHGGAERMIAYPAMLWLVALGGYLLAPAAGEPASLGSTGPSR
jgi:hypothetical membrane protein